MKRILWLALFLPLPAFPQARTLSLAWDPNHPQENVTNYQVLLIISDGRTNKLANVGTNLVVTFTNATTDTVTARAYAQSPLGQSDPAELLIPRGLSPVSRLRLVTGP